VREVMQRQVVGVQAETTLQDFAASIASDGHAAFPVYEGSRAVGMIAVWRLSKVAPEKWPTTKVGEIADRNIPRISPDCELTEALRLLGRNEGEQLLLVGEDGALEGIVTKTDILRALQTRGIARVIDRAEAAHLRT
jgi:predicted transcriptional regulator